MLGPSQARRFEGWSVTVPCRGYRRPDTRHGSAILASWRTVLGMAIGGRWRGQVACASLRVPQRRSHATASKLPAACAIRLYPVMGPVAATKLMRIAEKKELWLRQAQRSGRWPLARSFVAKFLAGVQRWGFTVRLKRAFSGDGAVLRQAPAKPTLPMIMRSTSLVASSSARATEP